jgi:MFS family permease
MSETASSFVLLDFTNSSYSIIGVSTAWQGVLTARFLDRLGSGSRSAPRDALIAASVSEENRGKAFGLEGIGDNLGAFIGPLIAIGLLFVFYLDIRFIFYLAFIPGLLAVLMVLLVKEKRVDVQAKAKLDVGLSSFPKEYWKYLLVIAIFGIGNSSNAFLILQTRNIGVPLIATIFIYAIYNLVAALGQLEQLAEIIAGGAEALAAWWRNNPKAKRSELVDLLTSFLWSGFERMVKG